MCKQKGYEKSLKWNGIKGTFGRVAEAKSLTANMADQFASPSFYVRVLSHSLIKNFQALRNKRSEFLAVYLASGNDKLYCIRSNI